MPNNTGTIIPSINHAAGSSTNILPPINQSLIDKPYSLRSKRNNNLPPTPFGYDNDIFIPVSKLGDIIHDKESFIVCREYQNPESKSNDPNVRITIKILKNIEKSKALEAEEVLKKLGFDYYDNILAWEAIKPRSFEDKVRNLFKMQNHNFNNLDIGLTRSQLPPLENYLALVFKQNEHHIVINDIPGETNASVSLSNMTEDNYKNFVGFRITNRDRIDTALNLYKKWYGHAFNYYIRQGELVLVIKKDLYKAAKDLSQQNKSVIGHPPKNSSLIDTYPDYNLSPLPIGRSQGEKFICSVLQRKGHTSNNLVLGGINIEEVINSINGHGPTIIIDDPAALADYIRYLAYILRTYGRELTNQEIATAKANSNATITFSLPKLTHDNIGEFGYYPLYYYELIRTSTYEEIEASFRTLGLNKKNGIWRCTISLKNYHFIKQSSWRLGLSMKCNIL